MSDIQWRPVVSGGDYEVSDDGRVRSSTHCQWRGGKKPGHELKAKLMAGYHSVSLYRGLERRRHRLVHRLVAEAFVPNPDNKPYVNHKDGNKLNNSPDNLEWVTNEENAAHAAKLFLYRNGCRHHEAKLSDAQVRIVRRAYSLGLLIREIAELAGMSQTAIRNIVAGSSWKRTK